MLEKKKITQVIVWEKRLFLTEDNISKERDYRLICITHTLSDNTNQNYWIIEVSKKDTMGQPIWVHTSKSNVEEIKLLAVADLIYTNLDCAQELLCHLTDEAHERNH